MWLFVIIVTVGCCSGRSLKVLGLGAHKDHSAEVLLTLEANAKQEIVSGIQDFSARTQVLNESAKQVASNIDILKQVSS